MMLKKERERIVTLLYIMWKVMVISSDAKKM